MTSYRSPVTSHAFLVTALALSATLAACGSAPKREPPVEQPSSGRLAEAAPAKKPLDCILPEVKLKRGGAYYLDDGPHDSVPANLDQVPDAVPRPEPLRAANMRPYEALGKTYTPMTQPAPYRERGIASWYGRRYHGQKTASGEVYDMYGMTAAHPTLPIPSYVRVSNLKNGRSVVLRVNDRGPFHADRVIDLSFTAACKLDILGGGSQLVEVEAILPGETPHVQLAASAPPVSAPEALNDGVPVPAAESPPEQRPDVMEALAQAPAAEPGGVYLQLGAFGARDNADNFLTHLRAQLSWLAEGLNVRQKDGLYRVHAGPYPSASDARRAAERIAQALGFKPIVTLR